MGTKLDSGNYDCLSKLAADEPFFVLRGQDIFAASLVREWAERASQRGTPIDKLEEALACAKAMEDWPIKKVPD